MALRHNILLSNHGKPKKSEFKQTIGGALMKEVSGNPTQITPTTPEMETNSRKMTGVSACHFAKIVLHHICLPRNQISNPKTSLPQEHLQCK